MFQEIIAENKTKEEKKEQAIKQLGILDIKIVQNGQLHPWGDSDYIWIIKTDRTASSLSILKFCQEHLRKNGQTYSEWNHAGCDLDVFFRGYFILEDKGDGSYKYQVHEPYAD